MRAPIAAVRGATVVVTELRSPGRARAMTDDPRIPGYEVEAILGVGGMGVVLRAKHLRLAGKRWPGCGPTWS